MSATTLLTPSKDEWPIAILKLPLTSGFWEEDPIALVPIAICPVPSNTDDPDAVSLIANAPIAIEELV